MSHHVVVVGLGYVGLPLALALAKHGQVTGFDIDTARVDELRRGHDRTGEVDADALARASLKLTASPADGEGADIYIVTVPTPIDADNRPDLTALRHAARTVGDLIDPARCPIVVFESTVYPGVTEDVCGAEIAGRRDLVRGRDFRLGYSPERINPGDRVHRVETITKIVAGDDEGVVDVLAALYGAVNGGNIHRASSIRVAEAAKVIENAQRDINIAFINEVAQIMGLMNLPMADVLEAAGTKWNFLDFKPGLVGGHCIGVDPYYLAHAARDLGHDPRVILAGRSINDGMGEWVADRIHDARGGKAGDVLVLGLTFKENVPDLRNSRVIDVIRRLEALGHQVCVADPLADPAEAKAAYGIELQEPKAADIVVGAVAHDAYRALPSEALKAVVRPDGLVADIRGMWTSLDLGPGVARWSL